LQVLESSTGCTTRHSDLVLARLARQAQRQRGTGAERHSGTGAERGRGAERCTYLDDGSLRGGLGDDDFGGKRESCMVAVNTYLCSAHELHTAAVACRLTSSTCTNIHGAVTNR
jgi:hypothetical protein